MRRNVFAQLLTVLSLFFLSGMAVKAQETADIVILNAKIATVDNDDYTSNLGTVAQAMAIRGDEIVALGNDTEMRTQAGPNTRVIDLRGRTVLPGFISVHEHPYDWSPGNRYILKKVLSDDNVVTRILEGSPEENIRAFEATLREAVSKARPGQWIYIVFRLGDQYQYSTGGNGGFGIKGNINALNGEHPPVTKQTMDEIAPDNPVLLRDVFVSMIVNQKALEEIDKVMPEDVRSQVDHNTGIGSANPMRWMINDVVLRDRYAQLREIQRLGLSWWAGYGMTAFASQAYAPSNLRVFTDLSRTGDMPVRNMWAWNWRENILFDDDYVIQSSIFMEGLGNDYFWYGGARAAQTVGSGCSTLEPRIERDSRRRGCSYDPGSQNSQWLYRYIKNGGRYAVTHTVGDKDIDNILDIIERASRDAGLTIEQVRAKRHTLDHTVMAPRPDQVERIKNLGIVLGGNAFEIYQASPGVLETYGEKAVEWVVPKKSVIDAQIPSGFEVDRALGSTDLTIFWTLARTIDRKAWDGKVYGQSQKISRELALKTITTWGAYFLLREDQLGSLEPGKLADFIVIDRDYLTIPEEEIEDIRVLMTVVGGKVVHLVPSLARQAGMQPTGAQVELGGAAASW